jgi:acyl carrier protein
MGSDAAADLTPEAAAKLGEAVNAVFDDLAPGDVRPELALGDIPGWDSMNSVNLVLELESTFDADLQGVMLVADQTVADVIALLREKGADV